MKSYKTNQGRMLDNNILRNIVFGFLILCFALSPLSSVFAQQSTFTTSLTTTGLTTLPPSVPTNLTATASSDTQIDLSWTASTPNYYPMAGYRIFRDSVFLATTTSTIYSDTGLIPETTYVYKVEGFDTLIQLSGQSDPATSTTQSTPIPSTPPSAGGGGGGGSSSGNQIIITDVDIIPSANEATITFKTNIPAQVRVQWGFTEDYEMGSIQSIFYGTDHSQNISGLSQGLNYKVKITAIGNNGALAYYTTSFVTVLPVTELGPLPNPLNFFAEATDKVINLSWNNPEDPRFNDVRIVRTEGFFPIDQYDGQSIYEGDGESFVDKTAEPGVTYYYAIFARDREGQFSSGALAQARIAKPGEIIIPTAGDPFLGIPESENVDSMIKELTLADFEFIQDGKLLAVVGSTVAIDGGKNLTIRLKYDKVPEILKTVAFTLQDPSDTSKVFPFLLRINSDKSYYESTIGALGKSGRYGMSVVILDYENKGLKRLNGTLAALVFYAPIFDLVKDFDIFGFVLFLFLIILLVIAVMLVKHMIKNYDEFNRRTRSIMDRPNNLPVGKIVASIAVIVLLGFAYKANSAFNSQINYQGKLVDSGNSVVADGNYNMRFKLYTARTGGSPIWTEVWCNTSNCAGSGTGTDDRITVTNGLFSTMLGSTTAFTGVDFNQTLYLGVEIGGSGATASWDGEMSPRKIIGAVPAAFVAETANTLSGLNSTQFFRTDAQNATSSSSTFLNVLQSGAGKIAEFFGTASQSVMALLSNGNVGIGTTTPYAKLSVAGEVVGQNFTATSTTATSTFVGGMNVAGTSGLTVLQNGNVGVGTTTPSEKLTVDGKIKISNNVLEANSVTLDAETSVGLRVTNANGYINITPLNTGWAHISTDRSMFYLSTEMRVNSGYIGSYDENLSLRTSGNTRLTISNSTGNVGIGTTSPYAKLSVVGQTVSEYFTATSTTLVSAFPLLTATQATTTNLAVTSIASSLLKTNADGSVIPAIAGTDYITSSSLFGKSWEIDANGLLAPTTTVAIAVGSTATSTFSGGLYASLLSAPYFHATSSTAISTFAGGISGPGSFTVQSSSGNVGIGTTLPGGKLDIVGSDSGGTTLNLRDTAAGGLGFSLVTTNNDSGHGPGKFIIGQYSNPWNPLFTIVSSSGNIGIGTTSPNWKLSVAGIGSFDDYARASYFTATSTTATSTLPNLSLTNLLFGSDYLTDITGTGLTITNNALTVTGATISGAANMLASFDATGNLTSTSSPQVAYINATSTTATSTFAGGILGPGSFTVQSSSGYVGIGTTTPPYSLSVQSNVSSTPTLGDELVTNGTFDSDLSGWTYSGDWSQSSGKATCATCFSTETLSQNISTVAGTTYRFSFNITINSGSLNVSFLGYSNTFGLGGGTYTYYLTSTTTGSQALIFTPDTFLGTGSIDNVSIKPVTGVSFPSFAIFNNEGNTDSAFEIRTSASSLGNTYLGKDVGRLSLDSLRNTGVGFKSLYSDMGGSSNTALGYMSLYSNISGYINTAQGAYSLYSNIGNYNTAQGAYSLYRNTTGTGNTVQGYGAMYNNPSATSSTAVGYMAGYGVSGQANQNNSLFGYKAGYGLSTGSNNILLGYQVGDTITTGSNNILIGYNIDATSTDSVNFLNIGNTIYGNTGTGNVGIGTTSPNWKLSVAGIGSFDDYARASYFTATSTTATSTLPNLSLTNLLFGSDYLTDITGSGLTITNNALTVTGATISGAANMLASFDASGNLTSTSSPQVAYINATSTTATSTFAGGILGPGSFTVQSSSGYVGIGTTSPWTSLAINATAGVDTFSIGSSTSTHFLVDKVGNVGIGTTSPLALLNIEHADQDLLYLRRNGAPFDFVQYRRSAGTWTNITYEAATSTGTVSGDILDASGDTFMVGRATKFENIYLDLGTAISSGATLVWEYSTGSDTWATLSVTDGTSALTYDGAITFTDPGVSWVTDSQNGSAQYYFVRVRVSAGTFTTEPTIYLAVPNNGTHVAAIYANALETDPSFVVDARGNVSIGYNPTANVATSHRLRVTGTQYVSGSISSGSTVSGSSASFTSGYTNTTSATSYTASLAHNIGFSGTLSTSYPSTDLIPVQNSPAINLLAESWNGSAAMTNQIEMFLQPSSQAVTDSRLIWGTKILNDTAAYGASYGAQLMALKSDGTLEVTGSTLGNEVLTNGTFDGTTGWTTTGDWAYSTSDYTFTYSSGSGTMTQTAGNLAVPLKPLTWYRFSFVNGVTGPTGTMAWIGTEVAEANTYFSVSTTEVDVYFKTNSNPGDFVIYTTANTTSGYRIDSASLKEVVGGNIAAYGVFTGGGSNGLKIDKSGNVGIGTTSPYSMLSVAGQVVGQNFTATSTTATSTLPNLSLTNLLFGSDYLTDITGTGLTVTNNALTVTGLTNTGAANMLAGFDASGNLTSTSSPQVAYINATSTTATSTFAGGLLGPGSFTVQSSSGNVGVGTTNPGSKLEVVGDIISKGTSWTARSAAEDNDSWNGATYGNGLFVAVGSSGDRVMTSPDGINWTARSAVGNDDSWYGATYGNGLFVVVGSSGDRVMTSPDGINWTARSAAGDNDNWGSATYGNGLFVAVGNSGDRVMTSPDGINWTARSAAGDNDTWASVTYGNGLFVAVGSSGDRVMTSPDGINWTARSATGDNDSWSNSTYGNGLFVAVGSSGDRVMTSPDGINWTARSAAGDNDGLYAITYGNGLFVAVGSGVDRVITSPDGINWTTRSAAGDNDSWYDITYGNGLFVAVGGSGDRVMTSGKLEKTQLAHNNTYQGGMQIFGNVGIGTTSPNWKLSVAGIGSFDDYARASYFTATSTTLASTFLYASTTALTVSGTNGLQLATGLTGPLQAVNGLVSSTSTLSVVYGGTGTSTAPTYGQLLVGDGAGKYSLTATSSLGILASSALGVGARGYIPYYASELQALTATSSIFIGDNSYLGIGTTTPTSALSVFSASSPQFQLAYDKDNYLTAGVASNGVTTLAVNGTLGGLSITNPQPTVVGSGTGTDAPYSFSVIGAIGGNSADTNIGQGGVGGPIRLIGGVGGTSALATFSETGGAGGAVTVNGGVGGAASSPDIDFMTRLAGAGGALSFIAGSGGNASNGGTASSNTAGAGGAFTLKGGTGGNASGATSNTGGAGGSIYLSGGVGGTGSTANGTAGNLYLGYDSSSVIGNVYFGNQSASYIGSTGNFGIGTTSPYAKLSVVGEVVGQYFTATSTATSTLPRLSVTGASADWLCLSGDCKAAWPTVAASATTTLLGDNNTWGGVNIFNGNIEINGTCTGTGCGGGSLSGGTAGMLTAWTSASAVTATGTPTAAAYTATSSTATSTFAGGMNVAGTSGLTVLQNGNVGIGTERPVTKLEINLLGSTPLSSLYSSGDSVTITGNTDTAAGFNIISGGSNVFHRGVFKATRFRGTAASPTTLASGDYTFSLLGAGYDGTSNLSSAGINMLIDSTVSTGVMPQAITFESGTSGTRTERMRITSSGNIGIGTSSPYAKLSVVGPVVAQYFHATSTTATSTLAGGLNVGSGSLVYDYSSGLTSVGGLQVSGAMSFDNDAGIVNWIDLPISSATAGTPQAYSASVGSVEVLTVYGESDGAGSSENRRVGIGTTTPFATLSVSGSTTSATSWAFAVADVASTTRFMIQDAGNVGIGTTSPWRTLSVTGTVALSGLTAETVSGSAICLDASGELQVNTGAQTCTVSSLRFKKDINDNVGGLDTVLVLKPSAFKYIYGNDEERVGFIAEDIQSVDPRLVVMGQDNLPRGVRYEDMTAVLVKSTQEIANVLSIASSTDNTFKSARLDKLEEGLTSNKNLLASSTAALQAGITGISQSVVKDTSSSVQSLADAIVTLDLKVDAFIASSTWNMNLVIASTSVALASSTEFIAQVSSSTVNVIFSNSSFVEIIAKSVKDLIASAGEWVVDRFTAKVAYVGRVEAETVAISKGMEIVDQSTGSIWCVTIKNGEWNKVMGTCKNTTNEATNATNYATNSTTTNTTNATNSATNSGTTNSNATASTSIATSSSSSEVSNSLSTSTPELSTPTENATSTSGITSSDTGTDNSPNTTPTPTPSGTDLPATSDQGNTVVDPGAPVESAPTNSSDSGNQSASNSSEQNTTSSEQGASSSGSSEATSAPVSSESSVLTNQTP